MEIMLLSLPCLFFNWSAFICLSRWSWLPHLQVYALWPSRGGPTLLTSTSQRKQGHSRRSCQREEATSNRTEKKTPTQIPAPIVPSRKILYILWVFLFIGMPPPRLLIKDSLGIFEKNYILAHHIFGCDPNVKSYTHMKLLFLNTTKNYVMVVT